ncbi:MAG: HAD hydrolase-like protein [Lysobacteraceae bacterium]
MHEEQRRCFIFDCDGVILDSNSIKTEAFREVAAPYGKEISDAFVDYHRRNGGESRYVKIDYLREGLLGLTPDAVEAGMLLDQFSAIVVDRLLTCPIADGLEECRRMVPDSVWLVVSGSDQSELRAVFDQRGLSSLFDGGIFGSPATKNEILSELDAKGVLRKPAVFLGDSRLDHEAAVSAAIDFSFLSCWTEFDGWQDYCEHHGVRSFPNIEAFFGQSTT